VVFPLELPNVWRSEGLPEKVPFVNIAQPSLDFLGNGSLGLVFSDRRDLGLVFFRRSFGTKSIDPVWPKLDKAA
jgi:hypothetical protein